MPTKKKSCDIVHQGVAGPAPDQILEAIRTEYWLPKTKDTVQPDQPTEPKTKVKP